ncbi:hypothetical protein ACFQ1L_40075 [Phytohabitans flavus]|uniref:hypothetical protein n=1 Tax=Phytohabitans flavus TaxID=1076124 RepID=UPI00362B9C2C
MSVPAASIWAHLAPDESAITVEVLCPAGTAFTATTAASAVTTAAAPPSARWRRRRRRRPPAMASWARSPGGGRGSPLSARSKSTRRFWSTVAPIV